MWKNDNKRMINIKCYTKITYLFKESFRKKPFIKVFFNFYFCKSKFYYPCYMFQFLFFRTNEIMHTFLYHKFTSPVLVLDIFKSCTLLYCAFCLILLYWTNLSVCRLIHSLRLFCRGLRAHYILTISVKATLSNQMSH